MATTNLTAQRLRELLHYDAKTGEFRWRARGNVQFDGRFAGKLAGSSAQGYVFIRVDYANIGAHRLAWLYMTGEWAVFEIDHINGNRSDNRIENLRPVTRRTNMENRRGPNKRSTPLPLGVRYDKRRGHFMAAIGVDYRTVHLGRFDTAEEAHLAYLAAKRDLHAGWKT